MNERQSEIEVGDVKDVNVLEESIRTLWQKVRVATETISHLREERVSLQTRLAEIEMNAANLRNELLNKDQELRKLRGEYHQLVQSNGASGFSTEEKEILKVRIRELIAKINSHLE